METSKKKNDFTIVKSEFACENDLRRTSTHTMDCKYYLLVYSSANILYRFNTNLVYIHLYLFYTIRMYDVRITQNQLIFM